VLDARAAADAVLDQAQPLTIWKPPSTPQPNACVTGHRCKSSWDLSTV